MILKPDCRSFFVFDLDDTIYSEIDYLTSAYLSIAEFLDPANMNVLHYEMIDIYKSGGNTFKYLIQNYPSRSLTVTSLLHMYRNHFPDIKPRNGVIELLSSIKSLNGKVGIITDGRSTTQRNKIKALGIHQYLDEMVISEEFGKEKPDISLFEHYNNLIPGGKFYYFGDNIDKDFIAPKRLGWYCIGINNDNNLRQFVYSGYAENYLPDCFIKEFTEIEIA